MQQATLVDRHGVRHQFRVTNPFGGMWRIERRRYRGNHQAANRAEAELLPRYFKSESEARGTFKLMLRQFANGRKLWNLNQDQRR